MELLRDSKGRVVPRDAFGKNYGSELDAWLEPLSDQKYTEMKKVGEEKLRLTLEETGYQNWDACQAGYEIQKLQDKIEDIGNGKRWGKKKFEKGGKLLGTIIEDLKVIPSDGKVPGKDVNKRVNDVLILLKLKYDQVGLFPKQEK